MRAAKIDANQPEIVAALRKAGATAQSLAAIGQGVPDLLVCYAPPGGFGAPSSRPTLHLLEVKDGRKVPSARLLTPDQVAWHAKWGGPVAIVESVEDALRAVGAGS